MKKIMIAMLLTVLSFNVANVTAASNEEVKIYEESINFVQNDFSERNSSTIFGEIDAKSDTKIEYTYDLIELKDNSSLVVFNGTINNQGEKLPIYAEGEVDQRELSKGQTYLRGSLRGTVSNGKEIFEVAIGFSGMEESKEASFGVTVYTSKEKYFDSILFFSFGKQVLDDSIREELKSKDSTVLESDSHIKDTLNSVNAGFLNDGNEVNDSKGNNYFVYEGYGYAYQNHSTGGGYQSQSKRLLKVTSYKDTTTDRVLVSLKTYTNNFNVDQLFSPSDPYPHTIIDVYVDEFKIGLKRVSNTYSKIDGIETVDYDPTAGSNDPLSEFLDDVATSTIPFGWLLSPLLEDSYGSLNYYLNSNSAKVYANMSDRITNSLDFDSEQFYSIFSLDSTSTYGETRYKAYGTVTYYVETDACLFVVDTQEANDYFYFYL